MGKVITVASGKGGTGKTTTVAAVSSCLAALGYKTLCIDFDVGLRNLDIALCMTDFAVADFMDVVNKKLGLMEACHESPQIPNLFFLAAPAAHHPAAYAPSSYATEDGIPEAFDQDRPDVPDMLSMFEEIRREFDYCVIDCPSGIGTGFRMAHCDADMSIIVTTGELPSIRDAQKAAQEVRELGVLHVRLVINRVQPKNIKWLNTTLDDIIDVVGVQLIGIVPEDITVFKALHDNVPLVLHHKRRAAYDFLDIARRVIGEEVPLRERY